ncbi:phosphoribosylanthranilate isomerase [Lederbergia graminis]|uniref:N-(5'-phosphoribosyl)anthranilate isomerase n=1 Tax=Lederbergia graminis TaxID=735518 RepID=A0ABW0LJP7_9BACI
MQVKICGIMSEEAALAACEAGADVIGFVFAESRRKISPERAAELRRLFPNNVKAAGVFVNETLENIKHIAEVANLDYIQLHGDETPEFCASVPYKVVKAFSIRTKADLDRLLDYDNHVDYFLLDSPGTDFRGGSGIPFDWDLLRDLPIERSKFILAGGLHAGNVQTAIKQVQPIMVDVSSGVETNGVKDLEKIRAFIKNAKLEESTKNGNLHITRS